MSQEKIEPVGDPGPGEETFHEVCFCYYCLHVLDGHEIFCNDGICPYCGHRDAIKGVTYRLRARRWVWEFKPTCWQRICGQRAKGHWEYGEQLFQWKDPNPIKKPAEPVAAEPIKEATTDVCHVSDL